MHGQQNIKRYAEVSVPSYRITSPQQDMISLRAGSKICRSDVYFVTIPHIFLCNRDI